MRFPLLDPCIIFKGVAHSFLTLDTPGRSGFKTVSVSPLDETSCGMVIDLDGEDNERSVVKVRVGNEDALRISTYILKQPLVDIVATRINQQEKKDEA